MGKPVKLPPKVEPANRDVELANQVVEKYADLDGLTDLDCIELRDLGISDDQCTVLQEMLEDGIITEAERQEALAKAEFSKDPITKAQFSRLIASIASPDGRNALRRRVRWLANNIDDVEKTDEICDALHSLPPDATAVPYLASALDRYPLEHQDKRERERYVAVRCNAAKLLGDQGHDAGASVADLLIKKVKDKDEELIVRNAALTSLGRLGPAAKGVVSELITIAKNRNEDPWTRGAALSSLENIPLNKKDVHELTDLLKDGSLYHETINALVRIAPNEKKVALAIFKRLNQAIQKEPTDERKKEILASLNTKPITSYFRKCLRHEDWEVRTRTAFLLRRMGSNVKLPPAAEFADNVVKTYSEKGVIDFFGLKGEQEELCTNLREAFKDGILDPKEHEQMKQIKGAAIFMTEDAISITQYKDPAQASWPKEAVDKLAGSRLLRARINNLYNDGGQEKVSEFFGGSYYKTNGIDGLKNLLKNENDPRIYRGALNALAKIGHDEKDAALAVVDELGKRFSVNPDKGPDAKDVLTPLGLEVTDVLSCLRGFLDHDDAKVRVHTALLLGKMGPAAKPTVPKLMAMAKNEMAELDMRAAALLALGDIGLEKEEDVHEVVSLLDVYDEPVRFAALNTLTRIAPPNNTDAAPAIILHLSDLIPPQNEAQNIQDKGTAFTTELERSGLDPEAVASYLGKCVIYDNGKVQTDAASLLGNMGPAAIAAMDDLIEATKDPREDVRIKAVRMLGKIAPPKAAPFDLIEALASAMRDSDPAVQDAALDALLGIAQTHPNDAQKAFADILEQ